MLHSQDLTFDATSGDGITPPGSTWANWKTSPSNTVMKDFRVTTYLGRAKLHSYSNDAHLISPRKSNFSSNGNPPPRQRSSHAHRRSQMRRYKTPHISSFSDGLSEMRPPIFHVASSSALASCRLGSCRPGSEGMIQAGYFPGPKWVAACLAAAGEV